MSGVHCIAFRPACSVTVARGLVGNGRKFSSYGVEAISLRPQFTAKPFWVPVSVCSLRPRAYPTFRSQFRPQSCGASFGSGSEVAGAHAPARKQVSTTSSLPSDGFGSCQVDTSLTKHDGAIAKREMGPWEALQTRLAEMLQRAGPVLATVCLALAWALVKPGPAFARSLLTRPLTISSAQLSSSGVNSGQTGRQATEGGATSHQAAVQAGVSVGGSGDVSETLSLSNSGRGEVNFLGGFASLSHSMSSSPLPGASKSNPPSGTDRSSFAPTGDVFNHPPSTSKISEPFLQTSPSQEPPSSYASSPFQHPQTRQNDPIADFLRNTGSPGSPSSSNSLPGASEPGNPGGGKDANEGKPKGVQARERLDVYYLPEQIPKPKAGEFVSDQGGFITPDWVTPRINQIVAGLKKDTETEVVVVAINALGKHAGVPEMVATELSEQWQIGGPRGNGLLFLYVNKGGSSWERTEGGDIEMDVPYKRQLAVKVLPGLEKKLSKWADKKSKKNAREAVDELRASVMAKMTGGSCTAGEVILEGVASVAEKVWVADGLAIKPNLRDDPSKLAARSNIEWVTVFLTIFLVWSWADRSSRLSGWLREVYAWSGGAFDRVTKRKGPPCSACGEYTVLRRKAKADEIKDDGARKEVELGSMGYYAYVCENLDCTGDNEAQTNLVGWAVPFQAKQCPGCGYRTVRQTAEPVRKRGLVRDGVVKRVVECQNCGVRGERVMRDPSVVRALRVWEKQSVDVTEDGRPKIADGKGESGEAVQPVPSSG